MRQLLIICFFFVGKVGVLMEIMKGIQIKWVYLINRVSKTAVATLRLQITWKPLRYVLECFFSAMRFKFNFFLFWARLLFIVHFYQHRLDSNWTKKKVQFPASKNWLSNWIIFHLNFSRLFLLPSKLLCTIYHFLLSNYFKL